MYSINFKRWLPGSNLALGLGCSPLALITSTSRQLLRSQIPSCISPKAGEARAWRPTSCPGPRPSTKLGASPTSGGSRHHLYEEKLTERRVSHKLSYFWNEKSFYEIQPMIYKVAHENIFVPLCSATPLIFLFLKIDLV